MNTITLKEIKNSKTENYQVKSNTARGFVNLPREWVEVGDTIIVDGENVKVIEDDHETRDDKINEIIEYFEDYRDAFNMAIEELDDYNGVLGSERVYPMWELCDHFGQLTLKEFLDKTNDNFDLGASYFKYTSSGMVESCEEPEYQDNFCDMAYAVEELHENANHIQNTLAEFPDLAQLFEELDEIENGEINE